VLAHEGKKGKGEGRERMRSPYVRNSPLGELLLLFAQAQRGRKKKRKGKKRWGGRRGRSPTYVNGLTLAILISVCPSEKKEKKRKGEGGKGYKQIAPSKSSDNRR